MSRPMPVNQGNPLEKNNLRFFFEPRSVAVIGLLRENYFSGYVAVRRMLSAGFKGRIYPVNPSYKEILGLEVYPSVRNIPGEVDLAIIIINCRAVPEVMEECGHKGVKAVVVISDGFAERDDEGVALQKEIVEIARQNGLRIIGPNTAGVANSANGFLPGPYEPGYDKLKIGGISLCAQTGMINLQAFPYGDFHYGVSKICDFGNKCDVDESDMLEYLEADPATRVIAMYLESIRDGRRFLEISKRVALQKPVLILKSGRTQEGAKVSASHTGSLAGDDQIFTAACKQAGIVRLEKFGELFELPKIFTAQSLPRGNRLGIITFTGGIGVLAIDEAFKYDLLPTPLSSETAAKLNAIFPGLGKPVIDLGPPMAVMNYVAMYPEILKSVLADDHIDCLLNVIWAGPFEELVKDYIRFYKELRAHSQKPVASWIYGPNASLIRELTRQLEDMDFPVFSEVETAIKALGIAYYYAKSRRGER